MRNITQNVAYSNTPTFTASINFTTPEVNPIDHCHPEDTAERIQRSIFDVLTSSEFNIEFGLSVNALLKSPEYGLICNDYKQTIKNLSSIGLSRAQIDAIKPELMPNVVISSTMHDMSDGTNRMLPEHHPQHTDGTFVLRIDLYTDYMFAKDLEKGFDSILGLTEISDTLRDNMYEYLIEKLHRTLRHNGSAIESVSIEYPYLNAKRSAWKLHEKWISELEDDESPIDK